MMNDNEVDQIDEYTSSSVARHSTHDVHVEDYLIFISLLGLITFEILATLKLNGMLDMYWIFVIIPLEAFVLIISYMIIKRTSNFFYQNVHDVYAYRVLMVVKILTIKTIAGLVTVTALAEVYPVLITEADFAAYTSIVFGLIWILIVVIYYKEIK